MKHPFVQVPVPFVCFALLRNSIDPKTAQCEGIRCEMWLNSLMLVGPSGYFDNMNGGVISTIQVLVENLPALSA